MLGPGGKTCIVGLATTSAEVTRRAKPMPTTPWFDDLPVVGRMSPEQAAAKLRELGEDVAADSLQGASAGPSAAFGTLDWLPFRERLWAHTAHAFGHLAPAAPGNDLLPIRHAGNIPADPSLRGAALRITLDRLRVAQYPGGGTHHILFDFYARHQAATGAEDLHFNVTCRAREGEGAAAIGYPIFVGLSAGADGVAFRCFTVNVKNDQDEALLGFLDSDVFRAGLRLASAAQPAIAPLAAMALGLTGALARRSRNVPVQDFYLGLDFGSNPTGARLALGSYLAVQVPESKRAVWDWDDWAYNPATGQVVRTADKSELLPYNYVVFGVSRCDAP
jgi:hypothetical protein